MLDIIALRLRRLLTLAAVLNAFMMLNADLWMVAENKMNANKVNSIGMELRCLPESGELEQHRGSRRIPTFTMLLTTISAIAVGASIESVEKLNQ